ncbi:RHS repeat-associated core domain protein containing protein [Chryseobacterium populi]|uniref:RHS repeat-associated core domain protein containing protein n=1 Tax=Chryseobacterium populi TaxID=1144316 RepID=J3CG06_9FLAO|nr:RHS repeat-associated core domain-containing protein [Chryseobacterium populi]EJL70929.1 RHS repeat-associated core domain protein containing protein [Chryseobacterium populi]
MSQTRNDTGTEIIEENNYYPFELKHERYNNLAGNPSYQYKYNGKELQTETGMYDFGARFYMPDLGRWGVVDPLAEKMTRFSPYNYAFNNPISFIDPDGREGTGWIEQFNLATGRSYTYDPNVNTVEQAEAAGYKGVSKVAESLTINGKSTVAGIEINHYSYSLASNGSVYDTQGNSINSDFSTEAGTAIGNVQPGFGGLGFNDGPIKYVGGAGDVTGIFEVGGMVLSSSGDSNAQLAALPLLVLSGNEDDALKVLAAEKGLWTSTKNMSSAGNAFSHFKKHGNEFPEFGNSLQYAEGAHQFMSKSPAGTLMKTRTNGDIMKYHPTTNTFGVTNSAGAPKTLFRPKDGMNYWLKQK